MGWVEIGMPIARLLAEGSFTHLARPTWDQLRSIDELGARLWVFLEAEDLGDGRRYRMFRSDSDAGGRQLGGRLPRSP